MPRFCLLVLFRRKWRCPAFRRITLPEPVTLNFLAMDLRVLIMRKPEIKAGGRHRVKLKNNNSQIAEAILTRSTLRAPCRTISAKILPLHAVSNRLLLVSFPPQSPTPIERFTPRMYQCITNPKIVEVGLGAWSNNRPAVPRPDLPASASPFWMPPILPAPAPFRFPR